MLPVVAKLISKIILERLKQHLYSTIVAEETGFRPGSSCTDHINTIHILIEQCVEHISAWFLLTSKKPSIAFIENAYEPDWKIELCLKKLFV